MKIFLISGSHPRHLYIHKEIINLGYETRALVMSREEMLPVIPKDLPSIDVKKTIIVKNYFKDHRIFMTSVIAACIFGGKWKIDDVGSYKSSFPSFLNILKKLGYKFRVDT